MTLIGVTDPHSAARAGSGGKMAVNQSPEIFADTLRTLLDRNQPAGQGGGMPSPRQAAAMFNEHGFFPDAAAPPGDGSSAKPDASSIPQSICIDPPAAEAAAVLPPDGNPSLVAERSPELGDRLVTDLVPGMPGKTVRSASTPLPQLSMTSSPGGASEARAQPERTMFMSEDMVLEHAGDERQQSPAAPPSRIALCASVDKGKIAVAVRSADLADGGLDDLRDEITRLLAPYGLSLGALRVNGMDGDDAAERRGR